MKNGLYYLAVPYQGTEEEKKYRTELSLKATLAFLNQGIHLFAPILYVNKIAEAFDFPYLEKRREIIMPYLFDFLKVSKGFILIKAEGWEKSWGIQQELVFCQETRIPVFTMEVNEVQTNLPHVLSKALDHARLNCFLGKD